jgi:hypothetical protein
MRSFPRIFVKEEKGGIGWLPLQKLDVWHAEMRGGNLNPKGRGGEPIIMIFGDEGVPYVVGYTKRGEEQGCMWVFKKEFMGLEEVGEILKKLDYEKKSWDLDRKKRARASCQVASCKVPSCMGIVLHTKLQ